MELNSENDGLEETLRAKVSKYVRKFIRGAEKQKLLRATASVKKVMSSTLGTYDCSPNTVFKV